MEPIVDLQLNSVSERLADRRIDLEVTPAARERLSIDGYDPVFGARPLRRLIQREVTDRVATEIIEGRIGDGAYVTIDIDPDGNYRATVKNKASFAAGDDPAALGAGAVSGAMGSATNTATDADDVLKQADDILRGMDFGE